MRIIEALLACVVIVLGFTISAYFSNSYFAVRRGEMEGVSINVVGLLGSQILLEKVERQEGHWEQDLRSCLESLLPANTFYTLKIHSTIQGKDIAQVSNIYGENITAEMNTASALARATVALPIVMNESKDIDAMLILDRSGSMDEKLIDDPYPKIDYLRNASKYFVDSLNMSTARVGVSSFSTTARLDTPLTNDSAAVKNAIGNLVADGRTNMGQSIELAIGEFEQHRRSESSWVAIIISDGVPNEGRNGEDSDQKGQQYATEEADELSAMDVDIYTIGLGSKSNFNETFLKQIQTDGYYYAPSAQELDEIYRLIISDILYQTKFDILILELTVIRPGKFD